jgi:hypothetical protein
MQNKKNVFVTENSNKKGSCESRGVSTPRRTDAHATPNVIEQDSIDGLDYLLLLLSQDSNDLRWPRTISTKLSTGKQLVVNSAQEALSFFKAAGYVDCRISAYPYWRPSMVSDFVGIRNQISANLIMIDLDTRTRAHARKLYRVLDRIGELLPGLDPLVLWSGSGYHIYIPIDVPIILENIKEFEGIDQVSTKFIRFAERRLSSGLSDSAHNQTVSLNNCMLRVPGSINSKNGNRVQIIKKWNGQRPHIKLLIGSFCVYLSKEREEEQLQVEQEDHELEAAIYSYDIRWIDKLLQTPISDGRKYAIWRILVPYLRNVKRMSFEQSINIVKGWLQNCSSIQRLDFNPRDKINYSTKNVGTYRPVSINKLREENDKLYNLLVQQGVLL